MNSNIKAFNELSTDELYQILRLRNEVFVVEQACVYQDCDNKDLKSMHLFYKDKGTIVAGVRIVPKGISYDEVSIGRVVTNHKYRRDGLGSEMMKKAIAFIEDEWNETVIRISAQEYLLTFYQNLGFEIVSDCYLEDDIPHVEMLYVK